MSAKSNIKAQNPLILKCQRLMEAFAKSDDERDFYLDRMEGFIVYVDLDKSSHDLELLEKEIKIHNDRYCLIPKLTFYETKKIMEGFVNEKVYDIDTKEKLLDIIQSKEARENFLEFVYDHHSELEKWQQYYLERSRIRIIEWLRNNHFTFVFEEDLEIPKSVIEKVKKDLFEAKTSKDVLNARKMIMAKAKSYYSTEALNPRPKRGRPPKQIIKLEVEPQSSVDIYTTVPPAVRLFLFTPDHSSTSIIAFSSKFESEEQMLASRKSQSAQPQMTLESLNQKLAALRTLSSRWLEQPQKSEPAESTKSDHEDADEEVLYDDADEEEDYSEDEEELPPSKSPKKKGTASKKLPVKLKPKAAQPAKKHPKIGKPSVPASKSTPKIKPRPSPSTKKSPPNSKNVKRKK
jgi:hypothetical protein